ncbi:transporter substrate-binding protein [Gellertiella hungarica]|uniref:Branched-chain amino acid transport system substrate-binding protein n=1 Tax=Gellertiella hungarica TaxID=1572859 RepID=A0A7W6J2P7_9HYPH|nr:transporter substrate-binding protein [Gellertiella hungarica]MBB4062886.1 branched-chain amino acid transport system substrate-binding protein [Gellertiella hungarica]
MAEKIRVPVGILFSRSGSYAGPAGQGYAGALSAIEAVNADPESRFELRPVVADPGGNTDRYAPLARKLLVEHGVKHIVGCTTSWSRKEVIPVIEKTDALLWYPCMYEGFEASENVVYVGACSNQHVLPILEFAMPAFGDKGFLVGSNYIWGWETCRLAREVIGRSGGVVLGERQVSLGDTDIGHIVEEIRRKRPDFILNSLVGPSSYAFLKAYRALGEEDPDFLPARRPVLSCNFLENEMREIAPAYEGNFTTAIYFQALETADNRAFLASLDPALVDGGISACFAQAYASVLLIRAGLEAAEQATATAQLEAVKALRPSTPLGPLTIDPATNHLHAPVHIARGTADGRYAVFHHSREAVAPDPFLSRTPLTVGARQTPAPARLRIVP